MNLTAEQFAGIVESLAAGRGAEGQEKRRAPRVEHKSSVSLTLYPEDAAPEGASERAAPTPVPASAPAPARQCQFLTVLLRNLSPRGLCTLHPQRLARGRQFVAQFPLHGREMAYFLCTVAHCRQVNPNLFAVGAEFTCVLPSAPRGPRDEARDVERARQSVLA